MEEKKTECTCGALMIDDKCVIPTRALAFLRGELTTLNDMRARWNELVEERDTLRARVSELESALRAKVEVDFSKAVDARVATLEGALRSLREALEYHGEHSSQCMYHGDEPETWRCVCGLDEALRSSRAALKESGDE